MSTPFATAYWVPCFEVKRRGREGDPYGHPPDENDTSEAAMAALGAFVSALAKTIAQPPPDPPFEHRTGWILREVLETDVAGFRVRLWWRWEP